VIKGRPDHRNVNHLAQLSLKYNRQEAYQLILSLFTAIMPVDARWPQPRCLIVAFLVKVILAIVLIAVATTTALRAGPGKYYYDNPWWDELTELCGAALSIVSAFVQLLCYRKRSLHPKAVFIVAILWILVWLPFFSLNVVSISPRSEALCSRYSYGTTGNGPYERKRDRVCPLLVTQTAIIGAFM
jgi:hypothetical protein